MNAPPLTREWFTAREIADLALPAMPTTERGVQLVAQQQGWQREDDEGDTWRARAGRGGGVEYHYSLLHTAARAKLVILFGAATPRAPARARIAAEGAWAWFERLPETKQAKAREKLDALDAVEALVASGTGRSMAMQVVSGLRQISLRTLYGWAGLVEGLPRADWLPALAPRHAGAAGAADCTPEAWEMLKADYLRPEQPNIVDCIRRVRMAAADRGWTLPSDRTLHRRLLALPDSLRTLARQGADALKRLYPAQQRDRSVFHALEAVNADGHKWDVFVKAPGDREAWRPVMVCFQDLYSGRILSWRVDRTENKEAVRLAFGDLVERWGIPDHCWLDNGRNFASKWLTGGTPNRYRFKVRDDEPVGVMTQLGVQVHWTQPYSGQSKPIERAFRDFAQGLAKHPEFAGAYTGNTVVAKPENYGAKAVPLDRFLRVVAAGIAEHNARAGRNTAVCQRRMSFAEAFDASYAQAPIRRASPEQRRLWLMAAEGVTVRAQDGSIHLEGNRFWSDFLIAQRGRKVVVRFDPQALHDDLHVYGLDGAYLGAAPCVEAAGFADADAARAHAAKRRAWLRGQQQMLDAERSMTIDQVAALLPEAPAEDDAPAPRVVRPLFGNALPKPTPVEDEAADARFTEALRQHREAAGRPQLRIVQHDDPDDA